MSIYREVYLKGCSILESAGIVDYKLDARLLLEHICGTNQNTLLAHPDMEVSSDNEELYFKLLEKRKEHTPLQHITGSQDFMGLTFKVNDKVLVPRQDTELLVEEVMTIAEDGMRVLDLCTGSGCILLSLMHYRFLDGYAIDISEDALSVAKENARSLEIEPKPIFIKSDMFSALEDGGLRDFSGYFDIIVSNPPYIKSDVIPSLDKEVKDHDPILSLDGGKDGLDFYKIIAEKASKYLTNYGMLFLEIGYDEASEVRSLLSANGFSDIKVIKDYQQNDRVVCAKYIKH